jgi:uncharacterized protein YjbI with pentapeptide repeats
MERMQPIRWMRQHKTPIAISLVSIALLIIAGTWVWGVLVGYINPQSGPKGVSDRQAVVQAFTLIAAGVIGLIGGIVGVANWDTSRRNLQQQRHLEEQRAQEDALQAYFQQIGELLTEQDLITTDREEVRQLAQAQSHTVLARLDGSRKGALLRFLHVAELIRINDPMEDFWRVTRIKHTDKPILKLEGADLSSTDLSGAVLYGASLSRADLSRADLHETKLNRAALVQSDLSNANLRSANISMAVLVWADLSGANLSGALCSRTDLRATVLRGADLSGIRLGKADLSRANLSGANLSEANLKEANLSDVKGVTNEQLEQQAASLEGATMPNGQKYEDWIKDIEGRRKDGEDASP